LVCADGHDGASGAAAVTGSLAAAPDVDPRPGAGGQQAEVLEDSATPYPVERLPGTDA
jgi:hypothetical protein